MAKKHYIQLGQKERDRIYLFEYAHRTMIYDNGKEVVVHETVTAVVGMKSYFAKLIYSGRGVPMKIETG